MRAAVGDWLRLGGRDADQSQRTGQIIEIHGADGEPPYLVRFRDGHTSLVIPGPEAVIGYSAPDEPATAPRLIFRVTAGQRRALLITAAVITVLAAALAWAGPAVLAAGVGIAALFTVYYAVAYATAYTECTPAGLRARGVTWRRFLPWARLRDIAVRDHASAAQIRYWSPTPAKPLRIAIVTADDGTRFWLGAPIDAGQGLGDPEFEDKIWQIRHYWRSRMLSGALPARRPPADHDEPGAPRARQAGSGIPAVRADPVPGQALNAFAIRFARAAVVIAGTRASFTTDSMPRACRTCGPQFTQPRR